MIILAWVLAISSVTAFIAGIVWWCLNDWKLFLELMGYLLAVSAVAAFVTGGIWGFTYILGYR